MKKGVKIVISLLIVIVLVIGGIFAHQKYQEYLEEEHIKNAIIKIEFINPLEVEFNTSVRLSDLITSINGTIIDDYEVDTTKVGNKELNFKYINEENIKVPYHFNVLVVDKTPPVIWLSDTYKVDVGTTKNWNK